MENIQQVDDFVFVPDLGEEAVHDTDTGSEQYTTSDEASPDSEVFFEMPVLAETTAALVQQQIEELVAAAFRDGIITEMGDAAEVNDAAFVPVQEIVQQEAAQAGDGMSIDPRLILLDAPAVANGAMTTPQHFDDERARDEHNVPPSHRDVQCVPCGRTIKGGVKNIKLHLGSNRHRLNSQVTDTSVRWSCVLCLGGRRVRSFTRRADLKRHVETHHPEQIIEDTDGRRSVPDDLLDQGRVVVAM